MINDEDFLTEELEILDQEQISLIEMDIQESYGMSYREYVEFRNSLVRKYNYKLPFDIFTKEIIKKITIDLVARGFTTPKITSPNEDISFTITNKGLKAINDGMKNGQVDTATPIWEALFELRNKNLLN